MGQFASRATACVTSLEVHGPTQSQLRLERLRIEYRCSGMLRAWGNYLFFRNGKGNQMKPLA